jgi:hypothetical protein
MRVIDPGTWFLLWYTQSVGWSILMQASKSISRLPMSLVEPSPMTKSWLIELGE